MILQAYEYEEDNKREPFFLQEFFDSTAGVFRTPPVKLLAEELLRMREKRRQQEQRPKQS